MLTYLQIRNFAIVQDLELRFGGGFSVITGETGAGKSILVDALALLKGSRADKDWVLNGEARAELSAEFDLSRLPAAAHWLTENALDDDNTCQLRRVLMAKGGSRAFINGRSVPLGQLQALGQLLVEIHGQHEHQSLLQTSEQRALLDRGLKPSAGLAEVQRLYREWYELNQRLQALDDQPSADSTYLDLLRFQLEELEQQALTEGEYAALEAEHRQLSHAEQLLTATQQAGDWLDHEQHSARSALLQAQGTLKPLQAYSPAVEETLAMLDEALINVEEARSVLQHFVDTAELNPERLQQVDQQIGRLHDLARKHRVRPGELHDHTEQVRERLQAAEQRDIQRERIISELQQVRDAYTGEAKKLHRARRQAGDTLSRAVTEQLQQLGMENAHFEIHIDAVADESPRRHGSDQVSFAIQTNPGQPSRPLKKIASGGELSRVALALKIAGGRHDAGLVQIFDEVDAGIGGETANTIGRLLARLAADAQVLSVTHLAQIAACADQQITVFKRSANNQTQVTANLLTDSERVDEIARMLSGQPSRQSRAHALELLQAG